MNNMIFQLTWSQFYSVYSEQLSRIGIQFQAFIFRQLADGKHEFFTNFLSFNSDELYEMIDALNEEDENNNYYPLRQDIPFEMIDLNNLSYQIFSESLMNEVDDLQILRKGANIIVTLKPKKYVEHTPNNFFQVLTDMIDFI